MKSLNIHPSKHTPSSTQLFTYLPPLHSFSSTQTTHNGKHWASNHPRVYCLKAIQVGWGSTGDGDVVVMLYTYMYHATHMHVPCCTHTCTMHPLLSSHPPPPHPGHHPPPHTCHYHFPSPVITMPPFSPSSPQRHWEDPHCQGYSWGSRGPLLPDDWL